jgi:uncharacterized membrane protein
VTLLLLVKTLHILAATVFLGTGMGTAYLKARADRSGELAVVAWAQREIVLADWIFTIPSALALPLTGAWMVEHYQLPWSTRWIVVGAVGYVAAGILWLPACFLQIRMRRLAAEALAQGTPLPPAFHRANRAWLLLGGPAFLAAATSITAMVGKWALFP